jgi:hypothetical protein
MMGIQVMCYDFYGLEWASSNLIPSDELYGLVVVHIKGITVFSIFEDQV